MVLLILPRGILPTANVQGICPDGWHLPTDDEWTTLTDYLGGTSIAGEKMKSTSGWNNNGNRTNSVGFNGLPGGGYRLSDNGSFSSLGDYGRWWSSSEGTSSSAWRRSLYNGSQVSRDYYTKAYDYSVRCIKD